MSLYTFAATNLTTSDDRKRQPAIDKGQITRTLILCALVLIALTLMAHRGETAESAMHAFTEAASSRV